MSVVVEGFTRVGSVEELARERVRVVAGPLGAVAVFHHEGRIYAVDNRCPHMGFPLARGSCRDGILTCHWHHARFDLESGGTFDPWADDVATYDVEVRAGEVWVATTPRTVDRVARWKARLQEALEQNLGLVIVKAVLALTEAGVPTADILEIGGRFGGRYRAAGWGPGLTILTAMANVLDRMAAEDRVLALYHGLVHVARDCAGAPPRFALTPLGTDAVPTERLKSWFRRFVEVRDADGAERALLTAIDHGASPVAVADMLFAAATDHYFLTGGHTVDFINKALEMLDRSARRDSDGVDEVLWRERAVDVLPALVPGLVSATRAEEQNAWRYPVDLVELLEPALARLPDLMGRAPSPAAGPWAGLEPLAATLLGDEPAPIVAALVGALEAGTAPADISAALTYAAALRLARFHTSNEFADWITVLHTLTYCNAVHQALKRAPSPELMRGVFHGAAKLYLDRFLNMPAARLPDARTTADLPADADALLAELAALMDREQQVNPAAAVVCRYLDLGHDDAPLLRTLAHCLVREDAEFHTYQTLEAGFQLYAELKATHPVPARNVLIGVARYLAAHAPTTRAMLQTARSAIRLARGEALYAVDE